MSLLLVEPSRVSGFRREAIDKVALRALDTATLHFEGCRVPQANLLGAEGMGFVYLMTMLTIERLSLAVSARASAVQLLRETTRDCAARSTRSGSVLDYQATRFALADALSEVELTQSFVDRCIADHLAGKLEAHAACMAKLRASELVKKVALLSLQLRGGRGTMVIDGRSSAEDLLDACVQTVWGGTSEIMKQMISQNLARYV